VALFTFHTPATIFALQLIGGSPALQTAAAAYFGVRILSAPATLANYALTGWFIGLSRPNLALALQLFLNLINIGLAIVLVLFAHMAVKGAALAAVIADYAALGAGLLIAGPALLKSRDARAPLFGGPALKRHLAVNGDIMIRTVCLMFAFTFFAAQGARLGDVALAANSVLRALTDLSAYVLDGFALAAEVLVGQAVGAKSLTRFRRAVLLSSVWAAALSIIVSVIFWAGGFLLIRFMTGAPSVREAAQLLLFWAVLTPIAGVGCFQLDGIFIGAAWTADMRNMMIVSLAVFLSAYALLAPAFGNHGLWASLMVFYAARAITLALRYPTLEKNSFPKEGICH
jgi:MATE family multidrug resistance protein